MDERYNADEIAQLPFRVALYVNPFRKSWRTFGVVGKAIRFLLYEICYYVGLTRLCYAECADIYHANDYNTLLVGWIAAKLRGAKIVYDTHEICSENHGLAQRPLWKAIIKAGESFLVRRVDAVVCVSHAASAYLAETYGIQAPLVVTNCAWLSDAVGIKTTSTERPFVVLNHGQFYGGRGYDLLIKASQYLKVHRGHIRIVLRGFGKCEAEYRELVRREQAEDFVEFAPPVLVNQLVKTACSSHVGIAITEPMCLNFKYSISNKLFEYLVAGLPVIMSDIPEHRYYNDRFKFGVLLQSHDPQEVARCIETLYRDQALYEKLKRNALDARQTLCWEVEGEKLLGVYRRLLGRECVAKPSAEAGRVV